MNLRRMYIFETVDYSFYQSIIVGARLTLNWAVVYENWSSALNSSGSNMKRAFVFSVN